MLGVVLGACHVEFGGNEEQELSAWPPPSSALPYIVTKLSPTKGDVSCGDAVIVGFPRAQALLPLDAVGLGSLRIQERDEDIMTGFNCGGHDDSRGGEFGTDGKNVGGNSVGNSRRFELFKYRLKNRLRFFER